ncbi:GNAT family N-acetyltransferase [Neiella marina]|uniref:GNAT family N-acetyltransferase n=1 Tax=Neiella marina TaxID=508461 RepID=UPI000B3CF241|nr:GNAT family N-acetyltransferase [Neiella marina]
MIASALLETSCLSTHRLTLRRLSKVDQRLYVGLHTNPNVMRYNDKVWAADKALRSFHFALNQQQQSPPKTLMWGVHHNQSNTAIGLLAFYQLDWPNKRTCLGVLLKPDAWGCGYATEALTAASVVTSKTLGLEHLVGFCHPDNRAMQHCFGKAGYQLQSANDNAQRWEIETQGQ